MLSFLRTKGETVLLDVAIVPGAKLSQILGEYNSRLKISLKAPAVDGKANTALVKFLSELTGVPKKCINIHKGEFSRQKTLSIEGTTAKEIESILRLLEVLAHC